MANTLEKAFIKNCENYAKSIGAFGTKKSADKKTTFFSVSLSMIKLQFVYYRKYTALGLPSTIFVRVYPNKNNNFYFHIPELLSFLELDDFRACYFPYIETEERMNACFNALTDVINTHLDEFQRIASEFRGEELRKYQFESVKGIWGLKDEDFKDPIVYEKMQQLFEMSEYLQRYSVFAPYYNLCCGKQEKAVKKYEKLISKNKAYPYEKRLLEHIKKPENADFKPITDECFAYQKGKGYALNPTDTTLKGYLIAFVIALAIYVGTNLVITAITSIGAVTSFGVFGNLCLALLMVPLGTFCIAVGFADVLNKISKDKKHTERSAYKGILETSKEKNFGQIVTRSLSVIFLLILVCMSFWTTRIYDTHILASDSINAFKPIRIEYKDIEKIYHMDARYNVYGDRIERPSYVIETKDGTLFDFDCITTAEETEEKFLPVIKDYEIEMINVDSHKDIPNYDDFYPNE